MTMTDDLLRETFAAEANTVIMPPNIRAEVASVVRRRRAVRTGTVAGGAVAAVGLASRSPCSRHSTYRA